MWEAVSSSHTDGKLYYKKGAEPTWNRHWVEEQLTRPAITPRNLFPFKHGLVRSFASVAKSGGGHELFSDPADTDTVKNNVFGISGQISRLVLARGLCPLHGSTIKKNSLPIRIRYSHNQQFALRNIVGNDFLATLLPYSPDAVTVKHTSWFRKIIFTWPTTIDSGTLYKRIKQKTSFFEVDSICHVMNEKFLSLGVGRKDLIGH